MKKEILKKYANLVVRKGVNLQPGQDVVIQARYEMIDFVRLVVKECYKAKARHIEIRWKEDPVIIKERVKHESVETLAEVKYMDKAFLEYRVDVNPCCIHLIGEDPDLLKGLNQKKLSKARTISYPIVKPYINKMESRYQWVIVGVATYDWAQKVFKGVSKSKAKEMLWEAILKTARVTDDPIKAWDEHNSSLHAHADYLTGLNIDYLEYKSSNGTDFKVWLHEETKFVAGAEKSLLGIEYNPNMPSEECFTSPIKGKAEGIVYATKPLSYQGELIEDFSVRFENGKAVEVKAKKGEELLKQMISMDEGACQLGECALVPFESPVNQTGILFYNTLYDENAVCHLALGRGFNECVKDFENKKEEDFRRIGINESMIHVDFMIGSKDLSIKAHTRDGRVVDIFKDGTWAK